MMIYGTYCSTEGLIAGVQWEEKRMREWAEDGLVHYLCGCHCAIQTMRVIVKYHFEETAGVDNEKTKVSGGLLRERLFAAGGGPQWAFMTLTDYGRGWGMNLEGHSR